MKKEDRIISALFEDARAEAPKVSFEQMAQQFTQQPPVPPAQPAGISAHIKHILLKNIGLNSIILVVGAGLVYYGLKQPTPTPELAASPSPGLVADSIPSAPSILPIAQPLKEARTVTLPSPTLPNTSKAPQEPEVALTLTPEHRTPTSSPEARKTSSSPPPAEGIAAGKMGNKTPVRVSTPPLSSASPNAVKLEELSNTFEPDVQEEKGTLATSRGTIEDQEKIDASKISRTTSIVLLNTYNQDATGEFFTILTSYGFELKKKRHRFKDGRVRNILMHLTHREGLDYKLRAIRFKRIEFKLYFDQSDQLYGFSVHMNNQTKTPKIISLSAKGNIAHQYRY